MKSGDPCPCGQPLPWHLFRLGLDGFSHICSCERRYRRKNGEVVLDGTERNPVAEFDRAHPEFSEGQGP